jgi:AcrR family transcriptional regulator
MASKGWNETSIDEITREAGVSRGLVSYHFKDKAELLSGVLARCEATHAEALAQAAANTNDPVEQSRLVIRAAIDMARDDPTQYEIFLHFLASARSQPELGEQIRVLYRGFRKIQAAGIRRGQRLGYYRADIDPEAAAARQVGTITGLAMQWLLDPGAFPFEDAREQMVTMLMDYLTHGAPRTGADAKLGEPEPEPVATP